MKKQNKKQSLQVEAANYIVQYAETQKQYLTKLNELNEQIDEYKQEILSEPVLDAGKQRKYKMLTEMSSKQAYIISLALNSLGKQAEIEIRIAELEMMLRKLLGGVHNGTRTIADARKDSGN